MRWACLNIKTCLLDTKVVLHHIANGKRDVINRTRPVIKQTWGLRDLSKPKTTASKLSRHQSRGLSYRV